ncbi:DNA-mis-repair domain-containing protein [Mycena indigotica]|uniref:DNA-mis-repair domain-containing protein n=1 Tax=Mycena indigotica TaxID=2126181 RepID=A0A8H6RZU8_9AGAR|nr:DNA-mis-repair domain-containing protein [Mycena indigotica]KAF7289882.1 DNA-mis-repair domain-containing protein [Mycena indigotica]
MTSTDPLPIRRLQESLINRIAAGEIIHRPASALKELVENCLDAGASTIRVTVKEGGLKLLQIQDNGCGIRKADLPILAERFTTSKISTFSDLSKIATYGFRGEALASMSHVARLSVITKTKSETCAWKAHYLDGVLVEGKTGQTAEPKPCAGNDGTTIIIEDLFYNTPTRLAALRSASEEHARILDVITKYAVHNPTVSFVCKKAGSAGPDLSIPTSSETAQTIRHVYGHSIAKDLLHAKFGPKNLDEDTDDVDMDADYSRPESWLAETHFTNPNYHSKKMVFLLFINHRLVESLRMKRALENVYSGILPKGSSPFIYLSLQINPRDVDVNVHPTKKEVHFLNEEEITDQIASQMQRALAAQSQSRVFEYQTLLTGGIAEPETKKRKGKERARDDDEDVEDENEEKTRPSPLKKTASQYKVRTSLQDRTLESMFPVLNPTQMQNGESSTSTARVKQPREVQESDCILTSVKTLRQSVVKGKHKQLSEILEKHTFVGIVDSYRCLSLIQYATKLYLVNHGSLAEELFYQLGLRQFGNFSRLKLQPPPSIHKLIEIAVELEETTEESGLSKPEIVERITETLISRREMLSEYFSMQITSSGQLESLPLILREYTPNLDKLPALLMRLGPQVNWSTEKDCFETFLRELAYFYVPGPLCRDDSSMIDEAGQAQDKAERWQIQHILFPALRRYFAAPKSLLDRDVVQIANRNRAKPEYGKPLRRPLVSCLASVTWLHFEFKVAGSMSVPNISKLTTPLFIGTVLNWALLGTLVVQVFIYYHAFPKDARSTKLIVAFVFLLDLLQTFGDTSDSMVSLAIHWGQPYILDEVRMAWFSVPVLGSLIASVCQLFFARRIRVLSRRLLVPVIICLVTAVQLAFGIWSGVQIARAGRFSRLVFNYLQPPVVWLSATALSDLTIVVGTTYYLRKMKPEPGFNRRLDASISRVIKTSVETGLLCAIAAAIVLALFVSFDGNQYHLSVCLWLTKVYTNSIMVILNSRAEIVHGLDNRTTLPLTVSTGQRASRATSASTRAVETRVSEYSVDTLAPPTVEDKAELV